MVANEQRAGSEMRESSHCKQRWQKINDQVSKFCGAYEAATREKSSGHNENDVLKHAHEIFYNNHKKKLTLEHAWKELRNDQKCSYAFETTTGEEEQATIRPAGDKASKRHGKKTMADGKALNEFESMWRIRKEDLAAKERLTKMRLLDSLIGKEYLAEYKVAFKKKLIDELLSN
ncbi:PREDICTED: glutathione S-transferase T3-like [Brassica oleracea var. oleracea]|uniref:glutathione S-transferase T3-like n=1 Tax=Brassica oleracea var. oleracea TaxID=109376 RepID=UPI0006A6B65A|nr:PREDICTED: glutathione S-transferase T3-like [Brassica oleracea var. oleracea]